MTDTVALTAILIGMGALSDRIPILGSIALFLAGYLTWCLNFQKN